MQTHSHPFHGGSPHTPSVDSPLTSALHKSMTTNTITTTTTTASFASAASQTELGNSSELPKEGIVLSANMNQPLYQSFQLSAQQEHSSPYAHVEENSTSQKENEREPLSSPSSSSSSAISSSVPPASFSTLPSSSISSPQSLLSSYHLRRPHNNNNNNDFNSIINNNYHISKSMYPKYSIPSPALSTQGSSITAIPIIHTKPPPLMQTPPYIFSPEQSDRRLFVDPFDPHSPLRQPLPFPYEAYEPYRVSPYVRPPIRAYAQPLLYPDHLPRPGRDFGMFVPPALRREDYVMYGGGGEPFGRRPDFGANFRCDLCNIRAGTEEQLMAHFKGKKHLARLEKPQGAAPKNGSPKPLDGEGSAVGTTPADPTIDVLTPAQTIQEIQPQQVIIGSPLVTNANHMINTSATTGPSLNKELQHETTNESGAVETLPLSTATPGIPSTTNTTTASASHSKPKSQQAKQRKSRGLPSVIAFPYSPQYYTPHLIPYYYRQPMYGANWGPFFPPPREASYPPAGFYSAYPAGPRRAYRSNPLLPAQPKRAPLKGCEVCNIPNFTSMQQLTAHMTGKKHIAKANPSPVAATVASTSPTATTTATKAILARPKSNSDTPTNSMSPSSSSDFPDGASSELQATDDVTRVHTGVAVAPFETSQEAES